MSVPELVVTLGPASFLLAGELARAGADLFRLNASHMEPADLGRRLRELRAATPDMPLLVDLQGAKMRLGRFPSRSLATGDQVRFRHAQQSDDALPIPHAELFRAVRIGQVLSCDDDRLRFEVTSVGDDELEARCLLGGALASRKAVNLADHPVELEDLCQGDLDHLASCEGVDRLAFAVSFMRDGREADWVRRRRPDCPLVGKIERRAAIEALPAIAAQVDKLWICRGDLGAQLGAADMARFVAALRPDELSVPVLMAGQVLEHLTHHGQPTRSEVCHLHDLLARSYSGVVLSDETAIGQHPVGAVQVASSLLQALANTGVSPSAVPQP